MNHILKCLCALVTMSVTFALPARAADEKAAPKRVAPTDAKAATGIDLKERKAATTDDAAKWVYYSCKKGAVGTWDLGKDGVEHVQFGTTMWVVPLLPNGESPDYYWVKENLASGAYYFAFKKKASAGDKYEILYSLDDVTYQYWDEAGGRLERVKP